MPLRTKKKISRGNKLRSIENHKIKPKDINDNRKMLYRTDGLVKRKKISWRTGKKLSPERLGCANEDYVPCRDGRLVLSLEAYGFSDKI